MDEVYDFIIVGGGIIGMATAYKLTLEQPDKSILVLEKEKKMASHQTGNNSGVIHSGIYYAPGSLKAKNCINGRKQLIEFAEQFTVTYELCGKLIAAFNAQELPALEKIYLNGKKNGLEHIKMLSGEESKKYEPYIDCVKSIYVPYAGIINYRQVVEKLSDAVLKANKKNRILREQKVVKANNKSNSKLIVSDKGSYEGKYVIFCAGLQSDEMAKLDGIDLKTKIIPFRGDYYKVISSGSKKVKGLIYPVPNADLPFLGVHLTKMYDGTIEAGPNAVFSFKKEGYSRTSFSLKDSLNSFRFAGVWRLFKNYWIIGISEYKRAFSKKLFLKSLQRLVPSLEMKDIEKGKSGVRAQALDEKGNLVDDFLIKTTKNSLHVINAPSPAATASLAIADEIIKKIENTFVNR